MTSPSSPGSSGSFLQKHDFLIRRLHSLSGLVPVGAYMCVHLLVNASYLVGPAVFQKNVHLIHSLPLLPVVEWTFIFIPILFHAIVGVWIAQTGKINIQQYRLTGNRRYTWQRITGYIAFVFIFIHVFQLHGWFHFDWWQSNVLKPLGGGRFAPYNAGSSLTLAMNSFGVVWPIFYALGVIACAFHLANGIWTAGITWGIWTTPRAQHRASIAVAIFGLLIGSAGLASVVAAKTANVKEAQVTEDEMYQEGIKSHTIEPNEHKRSHGHDASKDITYPEPVTPTP